MESFVTGEDRIDVEAIMEEIRRRVREKKAEGYYSDEELGRLAELELTPSSAAHQRIDPSLPDDWYRHHLDQVGLLWDARMESPISSHRRRVGRIIVWAKVLMRRVMRPYTNTILSRQSEFNVNVVGLLRSVTVLQGELWERLNVWNQDLRDSQHALQRMLAQAQEDLGNLRRAAAELGRETAGLGRETAGLREQAAELRQESVLHKQRLERILGALEGAPAGGEHVGEHLRAERDHLMDHTYFRFEQRFRGASERIRAAQEVYLPVFAGARDVLDLGCGRGEFLELLRDSGIPAQGVDTNEDMVHICQQKGLQVVQAEASEFLSGLEDDSLGGVFAAQVLEHLDTPALVQLVRLCHRKLRAGAPLVVETVNPTSVLAATSNFYLDLSHVKPIHPGAMRFLLEAEGFQEVEITFLSPVEEEAKLRALPAGDDTPPGQREMVELLNRNTEQLNDLLYGCQDYAAVARK